MVDLQNDFPYIPPHIPFQQSYHSSYFQYSQTIGEQVHQSFIYLLHHSTLLSYQFIRHSIHSHNTQKTSNCPSSQPLAILAPWIILHIGWSIPLIPPWATASHFLVGNKKAELKLNTFSSFLLFYVFLSFLLS